MRQSCREEVLKLKRDLEWPRRKDFLIRGDHAVVGKEGIIRSLGSGGRSSSDPPSALYPKVSSSTLLRGIKEKIARVHQRVRKKGILDGTPGRGKLRVGGVAIEESEAGGSKSNGIILQKNRSGG